MEGRTESVALETRRSEHQGIAVAAPVGPPIPRKKQIVVLLSAFATIAFTIGYNQCFGVFQEYYLSPTQNVIVPRPASQASPPTALLSFVGTLCYGLTWAGGILVNPVISRIEHGTWAPTTPSTRAWRRRSLRLLTPRTITILGVLMMSAGFGLASLSTSVWHLLLTQGLLVGFGMSLLYFPLLAPAPEYFTTHRATAMGFVSNVSIAVLSPFPFVPSLINNPILTIHPGDTPLMHLLMFSMYRLDSSWWRRWGSHLLSRDPGTAELRWWSLDSKNICLVLRDRRATYRLVGATEPIFGRFN